MTTSVSLCAKHVRLLLTIFFLTEGIFEIAFEFFDYVFAVFASNLFQIIGVCLTSKSNMIWLNFTFWAENLFAAFFWASDSEFSLMFCSFFWNLLSVLVFFQIIYISWIDLPNISTRTKYYSWNISELGFILYLFKLRPHNFSKLKILYLASTMFKRTIYLFMLRVVFSSNDF